MAKGRAIGRVEAFIGLLGLAALVVAYSLITGWNPLPKVGAWLDRNRTLSEPGPTWSIRIGDQPDSALGTRSAVLVSSRGSVQARDPVTGGAMWSRDVNWSAVAGSDAAGGAVVVMSTGKGHGYEVVEAATGSPLWSDRSATGVWTFADMILGIDCTDAFSCTLIARTPKTGTVRWQASLSGNARPFSGVNRPLPGLRPISKSALGAANTLPGPAPPLLGFPVDNVLQVVATSNGRRPHTYKSTQTTRLVVAGNRVLISSAVVRDGGCRFSVEAREPNGDREVWHRDGYDLDTSSDMGCTQRSDPSGGGTLLRAVAPDGSEVLLNVNTGAEVYRAAGKEKVLLTDGRIALVRGADGGTLRAVDVSGRSGGGALWSRPGEGRAAVALAPSAVVILDSGTGKLLALAPTSGQVLVDVTSGAGVLGDAGTGVVINIGRQVGLLTYRSAGG